MPSTKAKEKFKRALGDFIIDKKLQNKVPKANVGTYKDVIPYMAKIDRRWQFVTNENFNTSLYKSHEVFKDTLCYLLNNKEALTKKI